MSDDETISPGQLPKDPSRPPTTGAATGPYLDSGRSEIDTSVDSELKGPVRNYLPGDIVDGAYQLTSVLGRGGMGVVFACTHLVMGNQYAIKILSGEGLSFDHWSRFQAEAKALAKLNHPGIVGVYNMGTDKGTCPYYVMDLLSGEPLDALISKNGRLPVDQALGYFIEVADALGCAHAQGIIHRDIKPSNLMITEANTNQKARVKIVDFGIARLSKQSMGAQSQTATGLIFGTPVYMSPEQCSGLKADERSDIYSFGCSLFEALTGSPPLRGENAFQTFMMHQSEAPPRLADRAKGVDFTHSLELAVSKMLSKKPADRYQQMSQVMHDLERIKAGKEILNRGLGNTMPPNSTAAVPQIDPRRQTRNDQAGAVDKKPSHAPRRLIPYLVAAVIIVVAIAAGSLYFCSPTHQRLNSNETQKTPTTHKLATFSEDTPLLGGSEVDAIADPMSALRKVGCSEKEIDQLKDYNVRKAEKDQEHVARAFETFTEMHSKDGWHFLDKNKSAYHFLDDVVIGSIGFDDEKPVAAAGTIKNQKGKTVTFYQSYCLKAEPEFVDFFGPDDLTALELTLVHPQTILPKIKTWTRLEGLSFFNSLTKAMPNFESYDQSPLTDAMLPQLEEFTGLKSLGLCGLAVSGEAIAKMGLIHKIQSLRVKTITDPQPLMEILPTLDNLTEVWLLGLGTTDEQLESLVEMKNLESLRIRRSVLTPKSLGAFKRMKKLKSLYLDRNWSDADKRRFQAELPFYKFEPILAREYWTTLVLPVNKH